MQCQFRVGTRRLIGTIGMYRVNPHRRSAEPESATMEAQALSDVALASDWDEARFRAKVDGGD
jgi:hypothetical protein